jgi:argininosuccinate synthase
VTDRVVLAYSGGLDTSVAIGWIAAETGAEVVAVAADVGQGGEDLDVIRQRALDCGAVEAVVADVRDEYADEYCLPALQANALYMGRYPLVSALSRPLIAKHLVAGRATTARRWWRTAAPARATTRSASRSASGARARADGARAGPRLRHDARQGHRLREEKGLPIDVNKKSPYSIDQNVWGRAVETGLPRGPVERPDRGRLLLHAGPGTAAAPDELVLTFTAGVPDADRRQAGDGAAGHRAAQRPRGRAGRRPARHGRGPAGRHQEPRGLRGAGAQVLITAHQELEALTVERDLARFKRSVEQRWAELVYDGLWFSPLKRALDAFLAESQQHVSGDVRVVLSHGTATVTGRRSEASLYDYELATYDAGDTFDQSLAKGFVELWGMPSKLAAQRDQRLT